MSSELTGALVAAGVCVVSAPYLARLTLSAPDDDDARWWRGRTATGPRVAVIAAVGAVLGALGGIAAGATWLLPAFVLLVLVGAPLIVIDFEHHRLPNRLVFVLALGAPALAAVAALDRAAWHPFVRAALGAAAVFAVLFLLVFIAPKSFGYGDVKLGGILGGYLGWFGWTYVYYGIFGGFLLGALAAVGLLVGRRATMKTAIPFGPSLILGALVVLAFDLVPSLS